MERKNFVEQILRPSFFTTKGAKDTKEKEQQRPGRFCPEFNGDAGSIAASLRITLSFYVASDAHRLAIHCRKSPSCPSCPS